MYKYSLRILISLVILNSYCLNGPVGIQSPGQTCYMNSLFQSLLPLSKFSTLIEKDYSNNIFQGNTAGLNVGKFFNEHKISAGNIVSSLEIYTCFSLEKFLGKSQNVMNQNDTHEAFLALIDKLSNPKIVGTDKRIADLFTITYRKELFFSDNTSKMLSGDLSSLYWALSLPTDKTQVTLKHLLDNSLNKTAEDFVYNDTDAKPATQKQVTAQQLHIAEPPDILAIQLVRFDFDRQTGVPQKLTNVVDIENDLIFNYKNGTAHYKLVSGILHAGATASVGHYVAVVNYNNQWFLCNDSIVTPLTAQNAQQYLSSKAGYHAYILFYEKVGVDNQISKKNDTIKLNDLLGIFIHDTTNLYMRLRMQ